MNIVYTASIISHGGGGHIYSVRDTSLLMQKYYPDVSVRVVTFGLGPSVVLKRENIEYVHIYCNGLNLLGALAEFRRFCLVYNITHIHSFDKKAFFFSMAVGRKVFRFFTKPGGANSNEFYPRASCTFFFSSENFDYFKERHRSRNAILLSSRVSPPVKDEARIDSLSKRLSISVDQLVLLRIGRFSRYYEVTSLQAMKLHQYFRSNGVNVATVFIGEIEDEAFLYELRERASKEGSIHFVTDKKYTTDAAQLLGLGHVVVGTGRGFIEGALSGRAMFVPVAGQEFPFFVRPESIEYFQATNFSERSTIPLECEVQSNLEMALKLIRLDKGVGVGALTKAEAFRVFDIEGSISKIYSGYSMAERDLGCHVFDFCVMGAATALVFFKAYLVKRFSSVQS